MACLMRMLEVPINAPPISGRTLQERPPMSRSAVLLALFALAFTGCASVGKPLQAREAPPDPAIEKLLRELRDPEPPNPALEIDTRVVTNDNHGQVRLKSIS
jgi:hypothetical protein